MFCFDDKGIDGRDESLPGRDGGPRNGRAESARVHGSHDGAHRPHAQKRHHAQSRGGQRGGVKSGSFPEVPLPEPKNSALPLKQGAAPSELPPWMKFLHAKLANPSTPLNIRLFVSKLVINAEEVMPPPPRDSGEPRSPAAGVLDLTSRISAGVPAVRQTLPGAPPAARRVREQRRRRDPLHGGGRGGHGALVAQRGDPEGSPEPTKYTRIPQRVKNAAHSCDLFCGNDPG